MHSIIINCLKTFDISEKYSNYSSPILFNCSCSESDMDSEKDYDTNEEILSDSDSSRLGPVLGTF